MDDDHCGKINQSKVGLVMTKMPVALRDITTKIKQKLAIAPAVAISQTKHQVESDSLFYSKNWESQKRLKNFLFTSLSTFKAATNEVSLLYSSTWNLRPQRFSHIMLITPFNESTVVDHRFLTTLLFLHYFTAPVICTASPSRDAPTDRNKMCVTNLANVCFRFFCHVMLPIKQVNKPV